MVHIHNGSYRKASCTVYVIPLILLFLFLSSEIVSARVLQNPISKVKSMQHGNNMEINEVKNHVISRLLLQVPPRRDRVVVRRPPTPSGGQG